MAKSFGAAVVDLASRRIALADQLDDAEQARSFEMPMTGWQALVKISIAWPEDPNVELHGAPFRRIHEQLAGRCALMARSPFGPLTLSFAVWPEDQSEAQAEANALADMIAEAFGLDQSAVASTSLEYRDEVYRTTRNNTAGIADAADMLGVDQVRILYLMRRPGFPKPFDHVCGEPLWSKDDLEEYAELQKVIFMKEEGSGPSY